MIFLRNVQFFSISGIYIILYFHQHQFKWSLKEIGWNSFDKLNENSSTGFMENILIQVKTWLSPSIANIMALKCEIESFYSVDAR